MPLGPRPAGFTQSGEDAEIIMTLRGRKELNLATPGDYAVDIETRRHAVTPEESDLGGDIGGSHYPY